MVIFNSPYTTSITTRCSGVADFLFYYLHRTSDGQVLAIIVCLPLTSIVSKRLNAVSHKTMPCDSPRTLVFWRQHSLVDDPPSPWNLCSKWPTPFRTPQFPPISAHSALTVKAGKKVQLALIGSPPRAFQWAIDEPCTLPTSPPKGGTKRDLAVFSSTIQFLSKKVYYKVSLCENFQWQSCSYIISLSNGPWTDCGQCPHLPKICDQMTHPSENTDFDRSRLTICITFYLHGFRNNVHYISHK